MTPRETIDTAPLLPETFSRWFASRGWTPRAHQLELLARARDGRSVLLIAPTGGGKTLAGFLPTLVELSERGAQAAPEAASRPATDLRALAQGLHTLYISPLKALAVDIARNLETPVARDGPADPHRDPHRRHADLEAPAPAPRSARHPADHARATRAAAGQRRRAVSVRQAQARRARRVARAGHLQARRSAVARPGAAVAACARPRDDRPVGDGGRARGPVPLPGAAAAKAARAAPISSSPTAAPSRTSPCWSPANICRGPAIRRGTRFRKSTS